MIVSTYFRTILNRSASAANEIFSIGTLNKSCQRSFTSFVFEIKAVQFLKLKMSPGHEKSAVDVYTITY